MMRTPSRQTGLCRLFKVPVLLLALHPPSASGLQPLSCPNQKQLFATYGDLQDTLSHFSGLYENYRHGRPKTVAEHVKVFQLHAVAKDFLQILDAFRLFTCFALCPRACAADLGASSAESFPKARLVEAINDLKLDIELVADDPEFDFLAGSQRFLREAKEYAVMLMATRPDPASAERIDWEEAIAACVTRVVSRVMFPLLKVVSLSSKQNESHVLLHGVSLDAQDPAAMSASYISPALGELPREGEVSFEMLQSLATNSRSLHLSLAPSDTLGGLCNPSSSPYLFKGSVVDWPRRWRLQTEEEAVPKVVELLDHIEGTLELSHVYLALRAFGNEGWAQNLSCTGTGEEYDPTLCLHSRGWGGHVYSVNIHPPYKAELRVLGRTLGDNSQAGESSFMDVLHPHPAASLEHLFYRIDFIWRQANEPSPDLFFLHPAVHNCHAVEYLFTGAPVTPKVLVIPINPLVPPPFEVVPRFEAWWRSLRPAMASTQLAADWIAHGEGEEHARSAMDDYVAPSFWLGQCSLAAVEAMLKRMARKKFKYVLHHVHQTFAYFLRADLHRTLTSSSEAAETSSNLLRHWLEGWFCNHESRYFSKLELVAGPEMVRMASHAMPQESKRSVLCRFLERHRIPVQSRNFNCSGLPESAEEASLVSGHKECLRQDLRGWGNEASVQDSVQDSAPACEAECALAGCSFWTYDPTSMYGQPLCWVWTHGRPAEVKVEPGWVSGDADCYREAEAAGAGEEKGANTTGATAPLLESSDREFFKKWAVQQPAEIPGARYFLESKKRGRCVNGFCECFPPYRGPLCKQVDPGLHDDERNFSGVLHYLTSNDPEDIADLRHSLPRLWERFNKRFDYPVVVFNDGLSEDHRQAIVEASENRVWFAFVDDYLNVPEMITKDPTRRAMLGEVKWSMGYRGMCRFRSGTIFLQPVLQNFQYAMTLDTDGYFPADLASDPIAAMHAGDYIYTFSHLLPDLPGAVKHFWDYSLMYMRMKEIEPRGTEILQQFVREEDLQWNYQLYMNDIEVVQLDWFRSDPYQDYFRFLDSVGGFWLHRWGDHAVRTIAVGMWLPKDRVYEMDIPYGHQNYCRCSDAHPNLTCVREGDLGGQPPSWWVCAEKG